METHFRWPFPIFYLLNVSATSHHCTTYCQIPNCSWGSTWFNRSAHSLLVPHTAPDQADETSWGSPQKSRFHRARPRQVPITHDKEIKQRNKWGKRVKFGSKIKLFECRMKKIGCDLTLCSWFMSRDLDGEINQKHCVASCQLVSSNSWMLDVCQWLDVATPHLLALQHLNCSSKTTWSLPEEQANSEISPHKWCSADLSCWERRSYGLPDLTTGSWDRRSIKNSSFATPKSPRTTFHGKVRWRAWYRKEQALIGSWPNTFSYNDENFYSKRCLEPNMVWPIAPIIVRL